VGSCQLFGQLQDVCCRTARPSFHNMPGICSAAPARAANCSCPLAAACAV
jgi:hypothetical protein